MNPMNMIGQMMGKGQGLNPFQIIQAMQKSKNPMQMMNQMMGNNPQYKRVLQMVDGKSPEEVRQIASNLCAQRGVNFDDVVGQMRQMGLNLPMEEKPPEKGK